MYIYIKDLDINIDRLIDTFVDDTKIAEVAECERIVQVAKMVQSLQQLGIKKVLGIILKYKWKEYSFLVVY